MAEDKTRCEIKEVRAIRGTEGRTIDALRKQGWTLVTQDKGSALHTNLTFQRRKRRTPWMLLTAVGAVVAIAVTLGTVFGDEDTPTREESLQPTSQTSKQRAPSDTPPDEDASAPTVEDSKVEVVYPDENVFKYGQTALFEVRQSCGYAVAGGECEGHYPIEVAVEAPITYTPSDPKDTTQTESVYFTVTIRNLAELDTFDVSGMPSEAISGLDQADPSSDKLFGNGTDGDQVHYDPENDIGTIADSRLAPGESISFREGFSVANADDVIFTIRPYGLGGKELFFQRQQ